MNTNKLKHDALASGNRYFYSDKPCKNGHQPPVKKNARYGWCYQCQLETNRRRYRKQKILIASLKKDSK